MRVVRHLAEFALPSIGFLVYKRLSNEEAGRKGRSGRPRVGGGMYHQTIEEEREFLLRLLDEHIKWADPGGVEPGIERIETDILCPKCKAGRIIDLCITGISEKTGMRWRKMEHVCGCCHEEFSWVRIREDIYAHTPFDKLDGLDTPVGRFRVLLNGNPTPFRHVAGTVTVDGMQIAVHDIDIDTMDMAEGDAVLAGIEGAGLERTDSDERCVFCSAENDEWYVVVKGKWIDEWEVIDVDDYSFISEYYDRDGFSYRIHQDPAALVGEINHYCWTISLCLAWERKSLCDDYEDVIERAAY